MDKLVLLCTDMYSLIKSCNELYVWDTLDMNGMFENSYIICEKFTLLNYVFSFDISFLTK